MTSEAAVQRWIIRFRQEAGGTETRLLCFPHAGGAASYFHPLASIMRTHGTDVAAVQYPGRQERRREPLAATVDELVDQALPSLARYVDSRTVLFGHSMGAVVAFEAARRLQSEHGIVPMGLIASGRRGPLTTRSEQLHLADDDVFVARIRQLSGTDARLFDDPEMLELLLPALRADYRAIETHRHRRGTGLLCPLTVFVGDEDPQASVEEAQEWCHHTQAEYRFRLFPGDHFYLRGWPVHVVDEVVAAVKLFERSAETVASSWPE
ncbi:alpha/beta fold hydrolase [Streptomyces sp. NPDC051105]|uniref:thioesterase II family protein n=1 Tax=Streptomyces sp. NPDC051105 TaxID=3154843 RepID=UPI003418E221